MRDAVKGHVEMLLLAAVRDRPDHGYALIQELRRRSKQALTLPEGTVYPALHRLERRGLLTSDWSIVDGRRRRIYTLTERGRRELARQTDDWRALVRAMNAVVLG